MAEAARVIGSLPVANVQALSEACNNGGGDVQVHERYFSKDPSAEEVVYDSSLAIPVIDLQKLLDPESSEEECARLGSACQEWGFFQLINHGVADEVIGNLMKDVVGFFEQPLEAKKEWAQRPGSLEGYGQAFVVSEDQKLDWADMLYLTMVQPRELRNMRAWPTRPASFVDSVDSYSVAAANLGYLLLELMAKGVGADPASLRGVFQGQGQSLKVNYYPPCRQAADRVVGLSPHTDASGLTLVLQRNSEVQALQVLKDGRWVAVDVLDGAFIVNVGDVIEILTNGKFTSVEHRAVIHPTKERYSVVLFFHPFPDQVVAPLPEFMMKGDKEVYGSTTYKEFMKQYFASRLDGREHLERMKLEHQ